MSPSEFSAKYRRVSEALQSQSFGAGVNADFESRYAVIFKSAALDAIIIRGDLKPAEMELAERFVETFTVENAGSVMKFILSNGERIQERDVTPEDIRKWVEAGFENPENDDNTLGKVLDGRDLAGADEVTRRMQGILLYSQGARGGKAQKDAQEKYLPLIKRFIAGNLNDERLEDWAKAIMKTWLKLGKTLYPHVGQEHLRRIIATTN